MALLVTKKIKDIFKEKGLRTSDEAISTLNRELEKVCMKVCAQAAERVVADKLKTVKASHVPNLDALLNPPSSDI
ncbi:MAG: histone-like protein [Bdellovibrionales bacterium]